MSAAVRQGGLVGAGPALVVLVLVCAVVAAGVLLMRAARQRRRDLGTPVDRATFATLHTASLLAPSLREGLTASGAQRAGRHLRTLLGTPAVAVVSTTSTLVWEGIGAHHAAAAVGNAAEALRTGRTAIGRARGSCTDPECPIVQSVAVPLVSDDRVVGALVAYGQLTTAGLVRATEEVARWVSAQVELAELDRSRTRAIEAELRALRAQISPHFVYNSLAAIASFVRTDPERARELLLEFADFTRYAFHRSGEFTTLAEELRNVERYLELERARFGERLQVSLLVAPEVLPVAVPFLCVQPLVENAVRHGLEGHSGVGHVSIEAIDDGASARISVEDDGAGSDPDVIASALTGEAGAAEPTTAAVGLGNVDSRLRQVFGDEFGLVVETAPGAGTKVTFRVPKFAPGVRAG